MVGFGGSISPSSNHRECAKKRLAALPSPMADAHAIPGEEAESGGAIPTNRTSIRASGAKLTPKRRAWVESYDTKGPTYSYRTASENAP
jgi:hypothetical protein